MERNIREYFESETMPEDTVRRIEDSLRRPRPSTAPLLRMAAVFAVVLLAVGLFLSTDLMEVCADMFDIEIHSQHHEESGKYGEVAPNVFVSYTGSISDDGTSPTLGFTTKLNIPAEVRDGRLYFIANGENIDITDLCSMDMAFIYAMQDKTGIIQYIFVGGTPENWGYGCVMYDPVRDCWHGGDGHNHCGKESNWEAYGWMKDAKIKIGHPYPI